MADVTVQASRRRWTTDRVALAAERNRGVVPRLLRVEAIEEVIAMPEDRDRMNENEEDIVGRADEQDDEDFDEVDEIEEEDEGEDLES